jgi:hypothetical protein
VRVLILEDSEADTSLMMRELRSARPHVIADVCSQEPEQAWT